jgi:hypothetical protein
VETSSAVVGRPRVAAAYAREASDHYAAWGATALAAEFAGAAVGLRDSIDLLAVIRGALADCEGGYASSDSAARAAATWRSLSGLRTT